MFDDLEKGDDKKQSNDFFEKDQKKEDFKMSHPQQNKIDSSMKLENKKEHIVANFPIVDEKNNNTQNNNDNFKKIILLLVITFGFLLVCFAGYKIYRLAFDNNALKIDNDLIETEKEKDDIINENDKKEKIENDEKNNLVDIKTKDTDGDGLLDSDELMLGTDKMLEDTDNDGLSDKEEFYLYKTDPLNNDTDADGYFDGDEVKNGYNPKGEGKLFN